jgi:hypothetical protein
LCLPAFEWTYECFRLASPETPSTLARLTDDSSHCSSPFCRLVCFAFISDFHRCRSHSLHTNAAHLHELHTKQRRLSVSLWLLTFVSCPVRDTSPTLSHLRANYYYYMVSICRRVVTVAVATDACRISHTSRLRGYCTATRTGSCATSSRRISSLIRGTM